MYKNEKCFILLEQKMPRGGKAEGSIFGLFFSVWIIGIVYLGLGNTFSAKYVGVLNRGSVFTDVSCSTTCDSDGHNCHTHCTNTYYVDEIFNKSPTSVYTCTVRRLTPYYFKGDADNFVSAMKLGTSRQLYQTTYSHGTCIDDKIKNYYNTVGGILFGIPTCIMLAVLLLVFAVEIEQWRERTFSRWNGFNCRGCCVLPRYNCDVQICTQSRRDNFWYYISCRWFHLPSCNISSWCRRNNNSSNNQSYFTESNPYLDMDRQGEYCKTYPINPQVPSAPIDVSYTSNNDRQFSKYPIATAVNSYPMSTVVGYEPQTGYPISGPYNPSYQETKY